MNYRTNQEGETLTIEDESNGLLMQASALSNVGRVRGNNEDSVRLWVFEGFMLGVVADGMGGAAGGEEASRLSIEALQAHFVDKLAEDETDNSLSLTDEEIAEMLRMALSAANEAVIGKAAQDIDLHGMGTTTTLVFVRGKQAIFAHVGDSRAYWVVGSSGQIDRVTHDHSFVEALVSSGHLTPEQAAEHPMRNVLYRALGQKGEGDLEIDIYSRKLALGDRLVLCSDGLTRHLSDSEIAKIALGVDDPTQIAQQMIDLANERGGEDNISAVVLTMEALP